MIEQDIRKGLSASPSATGLSSLRDRAPTGLAPDGLQSTGAKATAFHPTSFEAFNLSGSTKLYEPLSATNLKAAEAEVTARWSWDRGDRFAIRELSCWTSRDSGGDETDRLHIYAVRKKSQGVKVWNGHIPSTQHERWLDLVCTVDLNVIAGIPIGLIGNEGHLHDLKQRQRPFGAQLKREK